MELRWLLTLEKATSLAATKLLTSKRTHIALPLMLLPVSFIRTFRAARPLRESRLCRTTANELEEQGVHVDLGPDNWFLGSLRDVGSLHSDYRHGTGAELGRRDAIAIYPVTGGGKKKSRYSGTIGQLDTP
ncbi:MAG: hypothetical protein ABR953_05605 [Candidatus Acidiferrales bacterium]